MQDDTLCITYDVRGILAGDKSTQVGDGLLLVTFMECFPVYIVTAPALTNSLPSVRNCSKCFILSHSNLIAPQ